MVFRLTINRKSDEVEHVVFSVGFAVGFGLGNLIVFHLKYEESVFVCRRRSDFFQSGYFVLFYWKVIKPLNSIASGMDLLREQDFSSRLAPVGQAEADRIVEMFNRMMDQLKNERLRLREQNHFWTCSLMCRLWG